MKPYFLILAACVFLASVMVVPEVYAQFGGGMGSGMGAPGGRRGGDERPNKGCDMPDKSAAGKGPMGAPEPMSREQLEYQLGTTQVDLHLTPEQGAAWQTFADRVLALQGDLSRQRARGATATASNPGAIKSVSLAVDAARNHLSALEDIETAEKALYQTLQADQKTLADLRLTAFLLPLLRG